MHGVVVQLVDTWLLKSHAHLGSLGSNPTFPTRFNLLFQVGNVKDCLNPDISHYFFW